MAETATHIPTPLEARKRTIEPATALASVDELHTRVDKLSHDLLDQKFSEATSIEVYDFIIDARKKGIDTNVAESVLMDKLADEFEERNMPLEEQNALLDELSDNIYGISKESASAEEPQSLLEGNADDEPQDDEASQYALTDEDRAAGVRWQQAFREGQQLPPVEADRDDAPQPDAEANESTSTVTKRHLPRSAAEAAAMAGTLLATLKQRAKDYNESLTPEQRNDSKKALKLAVGAIAIVGSLVAVKYGYEHFFTHTADLPDVPGGNGGRSFDNASLATTPFEHSDSKSVELFSGKGGSTRFSGEGMTAMKEWLNPEGSSYSVKSGDTIWGLSEKFLKAQGNTHPSEFQIDAVKDGLLKRLQRQGAVDSNGFLRAGAKIKLK